MSKIDYTIFSVPKKGKGAGGRKAPSFYSLFPVSHSQISFLVWPANCNAADIGDINKTVRPVSTRLVLGVLARYENNKITTAQSHLSSIMSYLAKSCAKAQKLVHWALRASKRNRTILAPLPEKKFRQTIISEELSNLPTHFNCFGFVRGVSALDCAKHHLHNGRKPELLINVDIKNFFGSIRSSDIVSSLEAHGVEPSRIKDIVSDSMIELTQENTVSLLVAALLPHANIPSSTRSIRDWPSLNLGQERPALIDRLINHQYVQSLYEETLKLCIQMSIEKGLVNFDDFAFESLKKMIGIGKFKKVGQLFLPQGSPASPVLSNLACKRMDYRLTGLAHKLGGRYSRYVDDLSFTWTTRRPHRFIKNFVNTVKEILLEHELEVNNSKTVVAGSGSRMEVVGYIINSGVPTISKHYIDRVRKEILDHRDLSQSGRSKMLEATIKKESIVGKINFIATACPQKADKLMALLNSYEQCMAEHRNIEIYE